MNQKEIHDLVKLINKTDITEFKIKDKDFSIVIKTGHSGGAGGTMMPVVHHAAPMQVAAPVAASVPAATSTEAKLEVAEEVSSGVEFKSPMVGTFYRKPSPDKEVFVSVGDQVKKGDVICIIEAMKLFNEIECEMDGTIIKVLLDDMSPVEYDQPLYLIDPA